MRKHYVIDASVAAKWILPEAGSDRAAELLTTSGAIFHAPELCIAEVTSTLWKRVNRGELTRSAAGGAIALVSDLPLRPQAHQPLVTSAFGIAIDRGISVYDALYVAHAMSLD